MSSVHSVINRPVQNFGSLNIQTMFYSQKSIESKAFNWLGDFSTAFQLRHIFFFWTPTENFSTNFSTESPSESFLLHCILFIFYFVFYASVLFIIRPRRCRSAAAYNRQTFPWTICRSLGLSLSAYVRRSVQCLSLIHIWRCRRIERCRSRWSPYH